MSLKERTGTRDLTYSRWHRPESIGRYLDRRTAATLDYIDLDAVEYCHGCRTPLALIETARDVGQADKPSTVTRRLADRSDLPAYVVLYTVVEDDISAFRVKRVAPLTDDGWLPMDPPTYALMLASLRAAHRCTKSAA